MKRIEPRSNALNFSQPKRICILPAPKFGVAVANRLPNFNLTTDAGTMALISYIYAPVAMASSDEGS